MCKVRGRQNREAGSREEGKNVPGKYWPNRWVGGKLDFIPHDLLLQLSVTLARLLKVGFFFFFTYTGFLFEAISVELVWL